MKAALERDVRLVRFEDGKLEIALEPSAAQDAGQRSLAQAVRMDRPALDGRGLGRAGRADRAARRSTRRQAELEQGVRADPLVQAVLARFPGAEIVGVRGPTQSRRCCRPTIADDCRRSRRPPTTILRRDWIATTTAED